MPRKICSALKGLIAQQTPGRRLFPERDSTRCACYLYWPLIFVWTGLPALTIAGVITLGAASELAAADEGLFEQDRLTGDWGGARKQYSPRVDSRANLRSAARSELVVDRSL
jgi:hypothetical protein